jgi:hypothetical protein
MFDALDNLAEALREEGVVDTHYHVGPELIVRRYDVKMLADVAVPFGATLVLKNHTYPTTPLAALARLSEAGQHAGRSSGRDSQLLPNQSAPGRGGSHQREHQSAASPAPRGTR